MICGVGVDIIRFDQMISAIQNGGELFLERIYTPAELVKSKEHPQPTACLAKYFAGKEAIIKALGVDPADQIELSQIEIHEGQHHEPIAVLHGNANNCFYRKKGERILISLSYDTTCAIGFAVLEGSPTR